MFIIEWLTDYMNTSRMEMTAEIEMLGLLSIGIISLSVIGIITLICLIIEKIRKGKR